MNLKKIQFTNTEGAELMGRMEFPVDQDPHSFAIFAHCFTCTKNLKAVVNISRELTQAGFAVLRFDFTGLGESEGDFADTNFSGNVEDLVKAAEFLSENFQAPALLIGHSLGGAASIFAASQLESVKAVATIGAPADPSHVKRLLRDDEEEIEKNGKATVNLQGRNFTIKKQFLDDLSNNPLEKVVHDLHKALLIMHSPQDITVGIKNAEDLYKNARHPKSYISLDGADHLLTNEADARYAGRVIGEWAKRYIDIPEITPLKSKSQAAASLNGADGFTTKLKLGSHLYIGDEPERVGGKDYGPNPYDLVAGGLAACKVMTAQMYARRKGWAVENITVTVDHSREHAFDCEHCEDSDSKIDTFNCTARFEGDLTEKQKDRLLEIADRCPVHRTLTSEIQIKSVRVEG